MMGMSFRQKGIWQVNGRSLPPYMWKIRKENSALFLVNLHVRLSRALPLISRRGGKAGQAGCGGAGRGVVWLENLTGSLAGPHIK